MADSMAEALQYMRDHPETKYAEIHTRFGVPATTFRDRFLEFIRIMRPPPLELFQWRWKLRLLIRSINMRTEVPYCCPGKSTS